VDGMNVTLRHDDGTQMTHPLAPNVTIRTEDGQTVSAMDLAQKRVEVELDDVNRITSIEVASDDTGAGGVAADEPAGTDEPGAGAVADEPTATPPAAQEPGMAREADEPAMAREAEDQPGAMARAELPDTASPLPLAAIVGGLSLTAAFAARAYRRR